MCLTPELQNNFFKFRQFLKNCLHAKKKKKNGDFQKKINLETVLNSSILRHSFRKFSYRIISVI